MSAYIDIVVDGPPGPEAGRFVEAENDQGASVNAGEWIDRGNGLWALRIMRPPGYAQFDLAELEALRETITFANRVGQGQVSFHPPALRSAQRKVREALHAIRRGEE